MQLIFIYTIEITEFCAQNSKFGRHFKVKLSMERSNETPAICKAALATLYLPLTAPPVFMKFFRAKVTCSFLMLLFVDVEIARSIK